MAAPEHTIQESKPVLELLEFLAKMFDEVDDTMGELMANAKKWEQLKTYDLDLTDPKLSSQLSNTFSAEQIPLLLNILLRLAQYGAKYSLSDEKMKEMEEMHQAVRDIRTDLHRLLGDKN